MTHSETILPLCGLKVVEISNLEAVGYACRLLGQLGADLTKVEGTDGDPLRRRPPFAPTEDGSDRSIAFEFFHGGKQCLTADVAADRIEAADILVVDHQALSDLGLHLPYRRPGQLRVFVGPYGGGADLMVPTSAMSRLHGGTSGYIIPADPDASKRPAWPGPYVFECMHGVGLSVAIVAERARDDGGELDYSLQAYGLWLDKLLFSRTSTSGVEMHRDTSAYPYGGNIRCANGFVAILVLEEHQWRGLARMVDRPDWLSDPLFANGVQRNRNRAPIAQGLADWCAAHTVDEVLECARANDVPAGRCRSPTQVLNAEVAASRDFFVDTETPFGTLRTPTLPFGPTLRGR